MLREMLGVFHRSSQQKMAQDMSLWPSSFTLPTVTYCILSEKILSGNRISVNNKEKINIMELSNELNSIEGAISIPYFIQNQGENATWICHLHHRT